MVALEDWVGHAWSKLIQSVIRVTPTGQWCKVQVSSWVCLWKSIKLIRNTSSDEVLMSLISQKGHYCVRKCTEVRAGPGTLGGYLDYVSAWFSFIW